MKTFKERESECFVLFSLRAPFWHAYTSGKETPIIFNTEEDKTFVMNVIAQAAYSISEMSVLTFVVMDNHFHFIVSGRKTCVEDFFAFVRRRAVRSVPGMRGVKLFIKQIDSLESLRNSIVYVNRNGFVSNPSLTPFNDLWGAGRHYFNSIPSEYIIGKHRSAIFRKMFRGREPDLPENVGVVNGYISPAQYCDIDYGMSLFRDARQYFLSLFRNVESYADIAADIDDRDFLTDQELFYKVNEYVKTCYGEVKVRELSSAQRADVARVLRRKYRSSNDQIRRVLGLSRYEVDALFPLSASSGDSDR